MGDWCSFVRCYLALSANSWKNGDKTRALALFVWSTLADTEDHPRAPAIN